MFVEQTFADDTAGHWCLASSGPWYKSVRTTEGGSGEGWEGRGGEGEGFNTISQDEQWWSNNFGQVIPYDGINVSSPFGLLLHLEMSII